MNSGIHNTWSAGPAAREAPKHAVMNDFSVCEHRWSVRASAGKSRDVRAMNIKIITVSKENSKGATLFAKELLEKLER